MRNMAQTKKEERKANNLQIGARLKHARQMAGMRMRDLAEKVGCTESSISKIESGRTAPSLDLLHRLVGALGRDMSTFFSASLDTPGIVLRQGERPILLTDPLRKGKGVSYERLVPFAAGNLLEANIHIVEPKCSKEDPITHQGETVGYVIEGQLELTIDTENFTISIGDSFFFHNHFTNSYRNPGPGAARVLWINTPQVH
ncbi:MAG: helix-turn-helix domain-containing protein [Albidovulum sp.]